MSPWFGCIVLALAIIYVLAWVSMSKAHGPAEWIQRGQYKNSLGELCCGERDCFELASGDVKQGQLRGTPGYFIGSTGEFVQQSEATPSPTGTYWRCAWGGHRKCFFAPLPGS